MKKTCIYIYTHDIKPQHSIKCNNETKFTRECKQNGRVVNTEEWSVYHPLSSSLSSLSSSPSTASSASKCNHKLLFKNTCSFYINRSQKWSWELMEPFFMTSVIGDSDGLCLEWAIFTPPLIGLYLLHQRIEGNPRPNIPPVAEDPLRRG